MRTQVSKMINCKYDDDKDAFYELNKEHFQHKKGESDKRHEAFNKAKNSSAPQCKKYATRKNLQKFITCFNNIYEK